MKANSWEVIKRSIGSPVPAKAQAPNGEKFNLSLQLVNLPASRSSYISNFVNSQLWIFFFFAVSKTNETKRYKQKLLNLFNIGQKKMLHKNGLSSLQMSVAWNN